MLAAPAQALAHQPPSKQEGVRTLTPTEMQKIVGATNPQIALGHTGMAVGTDIGPNLVTPYWTISLNGSGSMDFIPSFNPVTAEPVPTAGR
jgi:hypothetical protein